MDEITVGVNWLAVVLGAIASFVLGWLWFSPALFGVKWAEGVGVDLGKTNEMPIGAMIFQVVGLILLSWFVGLGALSVVILATLAFTVLAYSGGIFAQKSSAARLIEAGYWGAALVVMLIVHAFVPSL